MVRSPSPASQNVRSIHDLKWSPTEKAVARKAFDRSLQRELNAIIHAAKEQASRIEQPHELWELESWLTERRKEIDRKYDYRYSVLPLVFAGLIREDRLAQDELSGLGEDKLDYIHRIVSL